MILFLAFHPSVIIVSRKFQDKVEMQVEEIKALHARMQQSHETHLVETNTLKHQIEQYKGATNQGPLLQKLADENKQLKDAMAQKQ